MKEVIFVFLGGGIGSALRYLCSLFLNGQAGSSAFPWATFCVNIAGCFLIGLLSGIAGKTGMSEPVRLMLTVGICGGFTTFSTFCNESFSLLRNGNYLIFALYITLSILLGILFVVLGNTVGK